MMLIFLFLPLISLCQSASVLIMPTTLHPSHPYIMSHLANELSTRGHTVTWLEYGPVESNTKLEKNVQRLFYKSNFKSDFFNDLYITKEHPHHSKIWSNDYEAPQEWTTDWLAGLQLCDNFLAKHKKSFDGLINKKFDTIIVDDQANPCGLLLAGLRGDVFIYWSLTGLRPESAWANQSPNPPSYLPVPGTKLTENMDFKQRTENLIAYLAVIYTHQQIVQPRIDAVFKKYYKNAPTAFFMERNASINFVNTPPIFDFARPFMPRVNFVGGLHAVKNPDLRGEILRFVEHEDAKDGFIVFSSGFEVDWSKAPSFVIEALIGAFQAHPNIRFVWQYNGPEIDLLPMNVLTWAKIPQQDLLAHKKCLAHITLGGLNSIIESVYYGKPIIGIPLTAHNYDNILRVTERGGGILVPKDSIQLNTIKKAITNIQAKKYQREMKVFQEMVRDVPYTELEHAAFWVEFIERHHEVPHARSGADKLNILQYFLVDVIIFLSAVAAVIISITYFILRAIFRFLWSIVRYFTGSQQKKQPIVDKKKKKN